MRGKWRAQRADRGAHAARGFVGGAASDVTLDEDLIRRFQCRTRLCGWCSTVRVAFCPCQIVRFNAARGFVGGAASNLRGGTDPFAVSMPHAALWVVQLITAFVVVATACCFNAARGFVGGAALKNPEEDEDEEGFNAARGFVGGAAPRCGCARAHDCCFNAARGFVGGAASSLSALFPLGGKSTFGKSPEIREF